MSKPKKAAGTKSSKNSKSTKAISDVAHPGTSAPSDTSKSIITQRPIMKDPMMVGDEEKQLESEEPKNRPLSKTSETKLTPLSEQSEHKRDDEPEAKDGTDDKSDDESGTGSDESDDGSDAKPDVNPDNGTEDKTGDAKDEAEIVKTEDEPDGKAEEGKAEDGKAGKSKKTKASEAKAAAQAEEDARTKKLVEGKKYFLPINAVEQRRSTQIAVVGVIIALILAAAWVDVALDAGLIHLSGIKPVTHLFSN